MGLNVKEFVLLIVITDGALGKSEVRSQKKVKFFSIFLFFVSLTTIAKFITTVTSSLFFAPFHLSNLAKFLPNS